ncbi:YceI family protein [uncultured Corynebacterium sp.]|uniref:YceI family protein n=1 Tax=uncultured Corynebacterium sp. TaxID=159447 RepID=UPI0025CE1BEA|nr:YceI family protein [uncultured Corynebacterium sp.]
MRKGIITLGIIAVIVLALMSLGPLAYNLLNNRGLQTADLEEGGPAASVEADGSWQIAKGAGANRTQAGYTFNEILPGQRKTTSGRADNKDSDNVTGQMRVADGKLQEAVIEVKVAAISSDVEKRDINVRRSILESDTYPDASYTLTKPVDISHVPSDGKPAEVKVVGDLKLHGVTKEIPVTLKVLRTGENIVVSGNVPVRRSDFGLESPDFVAAKIAEEGTIDLLLVFEQRK